MFKIVVLDYLHWYPTLSHTNVVFVPHLVNCDLVTLAYSYQRSDEVKLRQVPVQGPIMLDNLLRRKMIISVAFVH
jgi:hypothetical protein